MARAAKAQAARAQTGYAAGLVAAGEGRHGEAIVHFEQALQVSPNDPRVLFALGNTAVAIGHHDAAETFYRRVLDQEPGRVEVLVNLSNLLRKRGRTTDIIALLSPALQSNPEQAELWLTLGSALRESGDDNTADIFYREAMRLAPANAAAIGNLADLTADRGGPDDALALYDRVLALEPLNAQARLNRAILRFLKGDLEQGWADYEYRLAIKERVLTADHGLPLWNGDAAPGLRLLVTAEQGIGDQLMFAGVIPDLAARLAACDGRVILECEKRLVPLLTRSFSGVSVQASRMQTQGGRTLAHYDWLGPEGGADAAIAIGSLPGLLRANIADFPVANAYLKPDPVEAAQWTKWLHGEALPLVGLCWRSGSLGGLRDRQYAPREEWAAFLRHVPGTLVSLQYDAQEGEIAALSEMSGRTILVPPGLDQKQEIDRTAAMIANLDAVVSAPTSVAWISAGLGVPTLKVLYNTSWTSLGRDYEPFAPAARCIMPKKSGDWADAFAKAAIALSAPQLRS